MSSLSAIAHATFGDIPAPLRSWLLQLHGVIEGQKPTCRLTLLCEELPACLEYLQSLGLEMLIDELSCDALSFGPQSPRLMAELRRLKHVRIYLARSWSDARDLYRAEAKMKDYADIGLRLGYPVCCVEAAEAADERTWNSEAQEWRQTNLVAVGIEASTRADFHCNHLLTESTIASLGPVSCIAHYPCRLDCEASSEIGKAALSIASRRWPLWPEVLIPLLKAPVLYWPDTNWPSDFWQEYAGLALLGATICDDGTWSSERAALPLSSVDLPFPSQGITTGSLQDGGVLVQSPTATLFISFDLLGKPWLISWEASTVRRLPL